MFSNNGKFPGSTGKVGGKRPNMTDLTPEQSMQRLLKSLDKADEFY